MSHCLPRDGPAVRSSEPGGCLWVGELIPFHFSPSVRGPPPPTALLCFLLVFAGERSISDNYRIIGFAAADLGAGERSLEGQFVCVCVNFSPRMSPPGQGVFRAMAFIVVFVSVARRVRKSYPTAPAPLRASRGRRARKDVTGRWTGFEEEPWVSV